MSADEQVESEERRVLMVLNSGGGREGEEECERFSRGRERKRPELFDRIDAMAESHSSTVAMFESALNNPVFCCLKS